jgi:predicted small lipoprotein YifL
MRRKALFVFGVMLQIAFLNGCASRGPVVYQPPPLTAAEREEIQTRTFDADFAITFSAVIAVLQDNAWDLQDIQKESGVIMAYTKKRSDTVGPAEDWRLDQDAKKKKTKPKKDDDESIINQWTRWEKLTAHIEPWGSGKARVRISIVNFGALPAVTYSYPVNSMFTRKNITVNAQATEEQVVVEDPVAYTKEFTKIEKAVADRKQTLSQ